MYPIRACHQISHTTIAARQTERQKINSSLVVTYCYCSILFQACKKVLNQMTGSVKVFILLIKIRIRGSFTLLLDGIIAFFSDFSRRPITRS